MYSLSLVIILFLFKLGLRVFYRKIVIVGADRIPSNVPVVFVVNHFNAMVDALLVRTYLPREARFLAKSTLWNHSFMRYLLNVSKCIPVYRHKDSDSKVANNQQTFSQCHAVLAEKGAIALFPEGFSHSEPNLQPLKTGVARIVLGAEQCYGNIGTQIVPVGLTFDAKQKFRSRVLVYVGRPIDPCEGIKNIDPEDHESVTQLTEKIGKGLESVTLNYPSWEEAQLIDHAAELYMENPKSPNRNVDLMEQFSKKKFFSESFKEMKASDPQRVDAVIKSVQSYDRLLKVLSIRHEHVIAKFPIAILLVYLFRSIVLFLFRFPLAFLGIFLSFIPYLLIKLFSSKAGLPLDRLASAKLMAGLTVYPMVWGLEALYAGFSWGGVWGWWLFCIAPLSGMVAMQFLETHQQFFEEARAFLILRTQHEMKRELEKRLEVVSSEVSKLIDIYQLLEKK